MDSSTILKATGLGKNWTPCPRCAGQGWISDAPGVDIKCSYCTGTGIVYKGEPHHA